MHIDHVEPDEASAVPQMCVRENYYEPALKAHSFVSLQATYIHLIH